MNVSGEWHGEYTYGPDYGAVAGKSVPFLMTVTDAWLEGIRGEVQDDARHGGMPEPGVVRGRRWGRWLRFTKSYPRHYLVRTDGKLQDLGPQLELQFEVRLTEELPPSRILYGGALRADGAMLQGSWRILPWSVHTDRGKLRIRGGNSGSWTAHRADR